MVQRSLGLLSVFLIAVLPVAAQVHSSSRDIRIEYSSAGLSIHIPQAMSLGDVLNSLCESTRLRCQIDATSVQQTIAPGQIQGSWQSVLGRLLDGAKVNYVVMPPADGVSSGSLLVEARQSLNTTPAAAQPTIQVNSEVGEPTQPADEQSATGTAVAQESSVAEPSSSGPSSSSAPTDASAELGSDDAMSPFPGPNGQWIPIAPGNEPAQYVPFPDPQGHLVPYPEASQPQYLPFPDAQGNLVPYPTPGDQPPQYSPFMNSQGQPVPWPH